MGDKVKKYNNTYHSTFKIKHTNANSSTYIDFNRESNKEDPKFEVGDHVRISKCNSIFAKYYFLNWFG